MNALTYTTQPLPFTDRLVRHIPGVGTQKRPMGRNYTITDPHDIAAKLTASGLTCEILNPRKMKGGQQGWNSVVRARDMSVAEEGYVNEVCIHASHDGRHSLAIKPGALRLACYNQFQSAPVRIHHSSGEIREFLDNPIDTVRRVMAYGRVIAGRVEGLRGVGDGEELLNRLALGAPRLMVAAGKFLPEYVRQEGELSYWACLQALSRTRKPGALKLVEMALGENGWEETQRGVVPAVWNEVMA